MNTHIEVRILIVEGMLDIARKQQEAKKKEVACLEAQLDSLRQAAEEGA